jgi:hypothetical protein
MSMSIKYDADELGSSLQVSVVGGDREGSRTHKLEVQAGSALVVALTGGLNGDRWTPNDVEIEISNPQEKTLIRLGRQEQIFAEPNPQEGSWSIRVIVRGPEPSAQINAAAINPQLFKEKGNRPGWFRCETCKTMIKALVIAILFFISQWTIVAKALGSVSAYIGAHAPRLASVLALLIPDGLREKLLELLKEYVNEPIKRLLQRVCHLLGMCPLKLEAA